jgi:AraC-like DNA-binding protein
MTVTDFIPADILKPFIEVYKIIESQEELENRVLPNTSVAIAFRFRGHNSYKNETGKISLPAITVSGLRKSARLINYSKNTSALIVLFKDCGASFFFKEPLYELFETSIPLDSIINPKEITLIEDLLSEAQNNLKRVEIVEQFLLKKLIYTKPDDLVSEAIAKIHFSKGCISIKKLAGALYISNDAFEKRFRKAAGSSPKQFASIVRMSHIVRQKPHERFLDIAFNAGYYDQAHFNKDFKLFTGLTPTEFYKSATFW